MSGRSDGGKKPTKKLNAGVVHVNGLGGSSQGSRKKPKAKGK